MIITVDTGGTKTLVAVFDGSGNIVQSNRFPTPRDTEEYLEELFRNIDRLSDSQNMQAICLAVPGNVQNGTLLHAPNLDWHNIDLKTILSKQFPDTKIFVDNDANLASLAEMRALEPVPKVGIYVTLSTGIGTGLCVNGRLESAYSTLEGGRMMMNYDNKLQKWEEFASGKDFLQRHNQLGSEVEDEEIWQQFAQRAALGLQVLIPLFQPDHVVIGGSMGTHFPKYGGFLDEILKQSLASQNPEAYVISQAKHPEEAVLYGCYHYANDQIQA